MRLIFFVFIFSFLSIGLYGQNGKGLSLSMGVGFGWENIPIAPSANMIATFIIPINRKIEYVRALSIGIGKTINKHIIVGGDVSLYWAILDWVPDYSIVGTEPIPSINNINWLSTGAWGRYIFFPESRFHLGIMSSLGIHIGYPKNMGMSTIERKVSAYIGVHVGAEYMISDKFKLSYYYGKGKYNNLITIDYLF